MLSHSNSSSFSPLLSVLSIQHSSVGKWGVVTGATDGIGRAYANALAKAGKFFFSRKAFRLLRASAEKLNLDLDPPLQLTSGLNVALLSRTESKLTAAASEIQAKYKVETKVVAVDFGAATAADYSRIASVIGDLDVAVLVNNVGLSYDHAEYYDAIDDQLIDDLIAINIQATNKVCFSFFCRDFCFIYLVPVLRVFSFAHLNLFQKKTELSFSDDPHRPPRHEAAPPRCHRLHRLRRRDSRALGAAVRGLRRVSKEDVFFLFFFLRRKKEPKRKNSSFSFPPLPPRFLFQINAKPPKKQHQGLRRHVR